MKNLLRVVLAASSLACTAACAQSKPAPATQHHSASTPSGPQVADCPVFPADNIWNTSIDTLPVDPNSPAYIRSIGVDKGLHMDFGRMEISGIPFNIISSSTKRLPTSFEYRDDSDVTSYPIPANVKIEGGPASPGDRHILLIDNERCVLYELYDAHPVANNSWHAGSGAIFDLTSNGLRPDGLTSADAAGLPIFPGLVRYEEIESGAIRHALRFTIPRTRDQYLWPARHKASRNSSKDVPPLGLRLRLRASFDTSSYSPTNRIILEALKHYGMFLADNGSAIFISGTSDPRFDDDDLHRLTAVKSTDFEAVDESGLQLTGNSARVDPLLAKH